jgi:hypothetical protein
MAKVIQSLLPVVEKLQIPTAADVDFTNLAQWIRGEVVAGRGLVLYRAHRSLVAEKLT